MMMIIGLVIGLVFGIIAVVAILYGKGQERRAKRIEETPTSPVGSLAPGFAEIKGKIVAAGDLLDSPMTRKACVYYDFHVEEQRTRHVGTGKHRRTEHYWATVVRDKQVRPFVVDDGTGSAEIDIARAELLLDQDARARSGFLQDAPPDLEATLNQRYGRSAQGIIFNRAMRYSETVLEQGDELYVLGTAVAEEGRPCRFVKGNDVFIVSDRGEQAVVASYRSSARAGKIGGVVAGFMGVMAFAGFAFVEYATARRPSHFSYGPYSSPSEASSTGVAVPWPLPARAPHGTPEPGVAVALVVDTSGSMEGTRVASVRRVLQATIREQLRVYDVMSVGTLDVAIIQFGRAADTIETPVPMGRFDESGFNAAVGHVHAEGENTPLGEALAVAYREIERANRSSEHIFILTDGESNGELPPATVLTAIRQRLGDSLGIHLIGFQSQRGFYQAFEAAGSQVLMADDEAALRAACERVFQVILERE